MKRKILTIITIGSIFCMALTGCADFSYRNPAKADPTTKYVAEFPDGSQVEITKEEAEEIRNIQEEFGVITSESENDFEEDYEKEFEEESEEDYEEDYEEESETNIKTEEKFDIWVALGEYIGEFETLGVKYFIYANGAEIAYMNEYADSTIPEEIEYEGVTYPIVSLAAIPKGLTEFIIPSHIKYIRGAFGSNKNIETVTIPDTVEYFTGDFFDCKNLRNVMFLGEIQVDPEWGETAFWKCTNLQSVIIPEGVTNLYKTFIDCSSLVSVSLPNSLKTIGAGTFSGCKSLAEIIIPDSVTSIYSGAFSGTSIKHIDIPESVETLYLSAFSSCSELEELIIPDTVTKYGNEITSFYNMDALKILIFSNNCNLDLDKASIFAPKLELVIFPDSTEEIKEDFFKYVDKSNLTIQVPEHTVEYFQRKFPEINVVAKE